MSDHIELRIYRLSGARTWRMELIDHPAPGRPGTKHTAVIRGKSDAHVDQQLLSDLARRVSDLLSDGAADLRFHVGSGAAAGEGSEPPWRLL